MKAVEINKTGGPEVLEVKDISLDKPSPDEVTIEQKAIGLNYIDTYIDRVCTLLNYQLVYV